MCVCRTSASSPSRRPRLTAGTPPGSPAPAAGAPARPRRSRKSRGRDRRREPAVEALRSGRARGCTRPSRASARQLVQPQLARVVEPVAARPRRSAPRSSPANSSARYSRTCHGLPDCSAPLRRERAGRSASRRTPCRRAQQRLEVLEHPAGLLRRARSSAGTRPRRLARVGLDEVALEAQVAAHVAQARVLVGLRVGVDADDARARVRASTSAP